jgi:lipoate synthase
MKTIFKKLVGKPKPFTVAEVVSDFEQKVEQLNQVRDSRRNVVAANAETITQLTQQNVSHNVEAEKAENVAKKLKTLLGS